MGVTKWNTCVAEHGERWSMDGRSSLFYGGGLPLEIPQTIACSNCFCTIFRSTAATLCSYVQMLVFHHL